MLNPAAVTIKLAMIKSTEPGVLLCLGRLLNISSGIIAWNLFYLFIINKIACRIGYRALLFGFRRYVVNFYFALAGAGTGIMLLLLVIGCAILLLPLLL